MSGDAGVRTLITEGQKMKLHDADVRHGTQRAKQPGWARIADAVTHKVDGDEVDLNWVDWDNDRHLEG